MDILIRGNSLVPHLLQKVDWSAPLFKTASSNQALAINTDAYARIGRFGQVALDADRPVTLPTLAAGTDYAVYLTADGLLVASTNFTAPDGYTAAQVTRLGGFHFAPGGNAAAQAGGSSTPQINPYSLWDLKWRPACSDPRGMTWTPAGWFDIYLCNSSPEVYGTSRYGLTIADGASAPIIPTIIGGNGSTTYGSLTWFEAAELAAAFGKKLPFWSEIAAAAYGVTEQTSVGTDPVTTGLDYPRTSRFGLMQAAGVMNTWMADISFFPHTTALATSDAAGLVTAYNAAIAGSWKSITESRGSVYTYGANGVAAGLHGGYWNYGSNAGSRAALWSYAPSASNNTIGARFRSDHLLLP